MWSPSKVRTNYGLNGENLKKFCLKEISDFQSYQVHSLQSELAECLPHARYCAEPDSPLLPALSPERRNFIGVRNGVSVMDCVLRLGNHHCHCSLMVPEGWVWPPYSLRTAAAFWTPFHILPQGTVQCRSLVSMLSFCFITGPYGVPSMRWPLWDGSLHVSRSLRNLYPPTYWMIKEVRKEKESFIVPTWNLWLPVSFIDHFCIWFVNDLVKWIEWKRYYLADHETETQRG